MKITKDALPNVDHVTLELENCESYDIKSKDILDIWFDEIRYGKSIYTDGIAHDGRLVISKNAYKQLSSFALEDYADGTAALERHSEEYYFYNRITRWCDICIVNIYFKDGKKVCFAVDYDPLENELLGYEIEYSNCPSAELNENGDMLILFGKSSHSFHRVDNDYYNVIEGLTELLPQKLKGDLSVKIESIGNGGNFCWSPDGGLYIEMRIQNRAYKNKYLPLQIFGTSNFLFNFEFKNADKEILLISTAKNKRLFVQIGDKCNFYCKKIKVYEGF